MPGPSYPALVANAVDFDWLPPLVGDSIVYTANNTYAAIAKYFGQQCENQILAAIAMSTTTTSWQFSYTCSAGDAVGSPVYISGNDTVTTASASATATASVVGFIRFKGALQAASSGTATNCYLQQFMYVSGLSAGTAGMPCYLTNAGGYSATPGTVAVQLGVFLSATEAILFAGPMSPFVAMLNSANTFTAPLSIYSALTPSTMTVKASAVVASSWSHFSWTNAMVVALGASLTGNVQICTLPAKTVVKNAYVVITTAAGGTTTLTIAVGRTSAAYTDYIVASNAQAAANTVYGAASGDRGTNLTGYDLPSYTGTTGIFAHFISTVSNLSAVTNSTGEIFLETALLP